MTPNSIGYPFVSNAAGAGAARLCRAVVPLAVSAPRGRWRARVPQRERPGGPGPRRVPLPADARRPWRCGGPGGRPGSCAFAPAAVTVVRSPAHRMRDTVLQYARAARFHIRSPSHPACRVHLPVRVVLMCEMHEPVRTAGVVIAARTLQACAWRFVPSAW